MAVPLLPTHGGGAACPVCGDHCTPSPPFDHPAAYPFLPGGKDPMSAARHVTAPHRIVDGGRVVYGTGDRVPWDDAVKYGLVPAAEADAPTKTKGRAKKGPVEDRAKKGPVEDR